MSDTPKKKKRPRDTNQLAKRIVDIAVGDETDTDDVAAHRRAAGQKGGRARAESLSSEEKSKIAKKAALARWAKGSSDSDR